MFGMGSNSANLPENAVIIDVRSVEEYNRGHGESAVNIPLNTLEQNIKKIKGYNKPVITVCASGMRSGVAAKLLKKHDIEAFNGGPWQTQR